MARTSIGLVSDTHGHFPKFLREAFSEVQLIIHAGDVGKSEVLDRLETIAPTKAVRGNIDGGDLRFLPETLCIDIGGTRIVALHIAGHPKRPNAKARQLIREERADVIVVGHSHIPVVARVSGALWINPGAAGLQGFHEQRFAAILHIEPGVPLSMDRVHLGGRRL